MLTGLTVVVGLTVIVNENVGPVQPFAEGVTVIVATIGAVPALVATNDGIFPVPLGASPIEGALFVQAKDVPATGPVKGITAVLAPLQYATLLTTLTVGVGLTVTVKVITGPVHPSMVAVTLTMATTGALVALVAV